MWQRLRNFIEERHWERAADPSSWAAFFQRWVRITFYVLREFTHNRCLQQAAALTFTTLVSLVPLLAVAFSFFGSFPAFQGLEERTEQAIFETILATPLVEGLSAGGRESVEAPAESQLAEQTPEELLRLADGLPRYSGAEKAMRLYLAAWERGAPVERIRRGISELHFRRDTTFEDVRAAAGDRRLKEYRRAALPADLTEEQSRQGREAYREGVALGQREQYAEALAALQEAEQRGYSFINTRRLAAELQMRFAQGVAQSGDLARALDLCGQALAGSTDVLLLEGAALTDRIRRETIALHNKALSRYGEMLLALGERQLEAHGENAGEQPANVAPSAIGDAIKNLRKAALVLEHDSDPHVKLGAALRAAGRTEEADQEYELAATKIKGAAARGFSVAAAEYLHDFIQQVGRAEIGVLGVVFLLVTSISLLNTIEKTFNQIWNVSEKRPFWIKFTSYCTLLWLGPMLIGISILLSEKFSQWLEVTVDYQTAAGKVLTLFMAASGRLLPFITVALALLALYAFIPHTRVRPSSALWGALAAGVLIQLARPLFGIYIGYAVTYQKVYGSLAVIPVFLLWLWLLWLIVLLGAEIAFTAQNLSLLRYHDKLKRLSDLFIDRFLAARIMMYVGREFYNAGRPITVDDLAQTLQITAEEAADAARRLARLGLLTPVGAELSGYHPGKDLSALTLNEILSISDHFCDDSRSARPEDKRYEEQLEKVFRTARDSQREALGGRSLREFLQECEGRKRPGGGEEQAQEDDAPADSP